MRRRDALSNPSQERPWVVTSWFAVMGVMEMRSLVRSWSMAALKASEDIK
jgi:hypothetical protein